VAIEAAPYSVFSDAELLSYGGVVLYLSTTTATPSVRWRLRSISWGMTRASRAGMGLRWKGDIGSSGWIL